MIEFLYGHHSAIRLDPVIAIFQLGLVFVAFLVLAAARRACR